MESSEEVRRGNQISCKADTISQSFSTEIASGEVRPKQRTTFALEIGTTDESCDDNPEIIETRTPTSMPSSFLDRMRISVAGRSIIRRRSQTQRESKKSSLHRGSDSLRNSRKAFARSIRSFPIGNSQVEDHFSIPKHSSSYSYHGKDTLIFPLSPQGAIMLENDKLDVTQPLTVKYYNDATTGFYVVRAFHTLVALLVALLVFLFSIQVILFLWIGLAIDSGLTSTQDISFERIYFFLGTICSIPYFVYGTAEIMVRDHAIKNKSIRTYTAILLDINCVEQPHNKFMILILIHYVIHLLRFLSGARNRRMRQILRLTHGKVTGLSRLSFIQIKWWFPGSQ